MLSRVDFMLQKWYNDYVIERRKFKFKKEVRQYDKK